MARSNNLIEKLRWRASFLMDPASFVDVTPSQPFRQTLLEDARRLSWSERVRFVWPWGVKERLDHHLLLGRLRTADDGEPYFDIAGLKIFYRPSHVSGTDPELLAGVTTILQEAFLRSDHFYSPEVRIGPGDTVFDVGAHIGTSAILFSRDAGPDGRIYSFEPVHHQVLARNLRENGVSGAEVIPEGASDQSGEAEFALSPKGIDSRMAGKRALRWPRQNLPVVALDDFVRERSIERVDFIKMDIEGGEELALRGAQGVLERFRPKLSIASYHTDVSGEAQRPKLLKLTRELGYQVKELGRQHIYAW